jgi:Integrase core domain
MNRRCGRRGSRRQCAHKRIRPYTARTNGKAERFVQTSLCEWVYARAFQTSAERAAAVDH